MGPDMSRADDSGNLTEVAVNGHVGKSKYHHTASAAEIEPSVSFTEAQQTSISITAELTPLSGTNGVAPSLAHHAFSNGRTNSDGAGPRADVQQLLVYASLLQQRHKVVDALAVYEEIIRFDPDCVEAHVGRGMCFHAQGLNRPAFDCYILALTLDPKHAGALTQCGILYKEEGHLLEAAEAYRKALMIDPGNREAAENMAVVTTDLGTRLKLAGNVQDGVTKYFEAIAYDAHYAPAYYNLGVVYSEMGQYDTALSFYEKAAFLRPMYAEAHCNMGVIHKNRGDLQTAIACYERCLSVAPNFTIAKNNLAIALTDLGTKVKLEGNTMEGIAQYERALVYNSQYADAMYNLGVAYGEMMKFDKASVMYELALHFNPACAEACNNLGVIYKDRDNLEKAVECYQMALRIKPQFSQSLNNIGVVYTVQGKMDLALQMIHAAILANPSYAEAYNNLGVLHRDAGLIPEAIEAYEQCLRIDSDSRNAGQNRLLAMNYIYEGSDDTLYTVHRDWGLRFARLFPSYSSHPNSLDPDRKLVIGYISPDFFTHSVSYFIEAPLTYHDPEKVQLIVYSAVAKADGKTLRLSEAVVKSGGIWRDVHGLDEKKLAALIHDDGVDIAVELTGHTANNRLGAMACRPAPVQVTWIGYPNTTGLQAIDYRFTDALADPPDTQQKHVEELVRLPNCFLCYTPSPEAGPVAPTPAQQTGFITFGSFNNLAKITPRVVCVWARILRALPNARLLLKCKPFSCTSVGERFMASLEAEGVSSSRVDLLPLILLNHDHMQSYSLMDISLDTFPYAGTTTTCESLYMGVPCVTMRGSVHAHNVGVTLLHQLGLNSLVGADEDEYVQIAMELASDIPKLAALRASLRERMLQSPLCDGPNFTKGLERTYRDLWRRHCSSRKSNEKLASDVLAVLGEVEAESTASGPPRMVEVKKEAMGGGESRASSRGLSSLNMGAGSDEENLQLEEDLGAASRGEGGGKGTWMEQASPSSFFERSPLAEVDVKARQDPRS